MDSIDVTDSVFSLNVPDLNKVVDGVDNVVNNGYTSYIYIGIFILVVIGIFAFKYYQNRKSKQYVNDCEGGFCTMNENPNQNPNQNPHESQNQIPNPQENLSQIPHQI
jgi:hypothetical protein